MPFLRGIHAPPQGFTDRAIQTAAALDAACFLWLAMDTNGPHKPQDALRFPEATHLVRLPTPAIQEGADAYARRIDGVLTMWRGALPDALYVIGNEPEHEAGWPIDAWLDTLPLFGAMVRERFPGIRLATTPFLVDNAARMSAAVAAAFDAICCHTYWGFEAPSYLTDPRWGCNYLPLLAYGKPVYVSEVNASPANLNPATNWTERNRQVAQWIAQAAHDGVAGCCIFLADGQGEWAGYDVGPEAAADIRAQIPAPMPPPTPAPQPTPAGYSRDYDPRGFRDIDARWYPFVKAHNPGEADAITSNYSAAARAIDYDANAMIAQGCVETAVFTSQRWRNAHAAAGIGIFSDGTPDVVWGAPPHGDARTGIEAQADLLSDYFGNGSEPFGTLAPHGFGGMRLRKTSLRDLDGVWAADTGYSAAIVQYMNAVMQGDAPLPAPTPAQRYPLIYPLDVVDVLQGSDGAFSHGGAAAGFYAIDFAAAIGTPVRACADGVVQEAYWQDSNPISLRTGHSLYIAHDNGYATFSCHLSRFDVTTGDRVTQGQVIGVSGDPASQPNNGYGSGPHLHWEVWRGAWPDGVRVKMEGLQAAGIIGPWDGAPQEPEVDMIIETTFDDAELKRLWDGPKTAAQKKKAPFNKDFAIPQAWIAQLLAGRPLGFAVSGEEHDAASNRTVEYFSNGKISYFPADGSVKIN